MSAQVDDPRFWDKRYVENSSGWDLKTPTPVFMSLIESGDFMSPGSLFIPGCGKGYDAVYAAERGYSVTAVDFSEQALLFARQLAAAKHQEINFLSDDIFNLDETVKYDYIFEYVTYCAINPLRRTEYAGKLSSLLKKGGKLIALLFPVDGREGGPPYNVDVAETYSIFSAYLTLIYSSKVIDSVKPRKGREVLQIYKKTG